jgi:hypothetical protein
MDKIVEWPSERVVHGGIFHQRNVNYSKETHEMLKSEQKAKPKVFYSPFHFLNNFLNPYPSALMNETRLTMMQRNKINYFLHEGSALPQPQMPARKLASEEYKMRRVREIMDRSRML